MSTIFDAVFNSIFDDVFSDPKFITVVKNKQNRLSETCQNCKYWKDVDDKTETGTCAYAENGSMKTTKSFGCNRYANSIDDEIAKYNALVEFSRGYRHKYVILNEAVHDLNMAIEEYREFLKHISSKLDEESVPQITKMNGIINELKHEYEKLWANLSMLKKESDAVADEMYKKMD